MARFETWVVSDLKKPLNVEQLHGEFFSADVGANVVGVEVLDNGNAASLSGTVTGYIVRADGGTVTQGGTLSSNKASIVLPAAAYNVEGPVDISIKLNTSGVITTLASVRGFVHRATTDTIVDPGTVITMVGSVNGVPPDQTGNVTLTASNITSGTLPAAQVPNISAAKITSGTVGAARLPDMVGATASNNGTKGAVPAPSSGDQSKVLKGDGTWGMPSADDVGALSYTVLSSGYDLNNLRTAGLYYASGTPANAPQNATNGYLLVFGAGVAAKQVWFRYGTVHAASESNINDFNTYVRTRDGNDWGKWYQLITSKGGTLYQSGYLYFQRDFEDSEQNVTSSNVFRLQQAYSQPYFQTYDPEAENPSGSYTNFRLPKSLMDNKTYDILTTATFNPFYKANDTFSTLDLMPCAGYVTGSSKRIYLSVPVDKSMGNISSVAVNALSGTIRTPEGEYIGGSSSSVNWLTGNTVTAIKVSEYVVRVLIAFETAPTNTVNNTPISGTLNVTLKFS